LFQEKKTERELRPILLQALPALGLKNRNASLSKTKAVSTNKRRLEH